MFNCRPAHKWDKFQDFSIGLTLVDFMSIGLKLVDLNCSVIPGAGGASYLHLYPGNSCENDILVVDSYVWTHAYVFPNGQTVPKPQWVANLSFSGGQNVRAFSPNGLLLLIAEACN